MWLGGRANSQAALPAFILGLVMSSHYVKHRKEQERMRVVAFAFLTPFFFLKGGMNVSAGALWANLGDTRDSLRCEDGAEVRRGLRARAPLHGTARRVHDAPDVHGPHVRDDHLALRVERRDHRPDEVLAPDCGRRPLGDRADRDRAALLPPPDRGRVRGGRGASPVAPMPPAPAGTLESEVA